MRGAGRSQASSPITDLLARDVTWDPGLDRLERDRALPSAILEGPPTRPQGQTRGAGTLDALRANDAVPQDWATPTRTAQGKSTGKSLLDPQGLAMRIMPAEDFVQLWRFATEGAAADCGEPWPKDVIDQALLAGPHVSALTEAAVELLWDDIQYQVDAGFVKIVPESVLLAHGAPEDLKISRVAVVPQESRRDRIILNLSAQVVFPGSRRAPKRVHPSVNETTTPAEDQAAVKRLGQAAKALLGFMHDADPMWEVLWQKVDLSDGFWRMVVEAGKEMNFVFQMPARPGDTERYFVVPSSLQMGWMNSPPYFCAGTESTRKMALRVMALTVDSGIAEPHRFEEKCLSAQAKTEPAEPPGPLPRDLMFISQVFVDDFMNALAGPPGRAGQRAEQLWVTRATMHCIHSVFPPPEVTGHVGGKDSISVKKLDKGDATFEATKEMLGLLMMGEPGAGRRVGLTSKKVEKYQTAIRQALDSHAHRISLNGFQKILGKLQYASTVMPSMRGYFTPLNQAMHGKQPRDFVGLGKASEVREVLEELVPLLRRTVDDPSHISELVPPHLPHYYLTVDASGVGFGGVLLPCTRWLQPVVWRVPMPKKLESQVT